MVWVEALSWVCWPVMKEGWSFADVLGMDDILVLSECE